MGCRCAKPSFLLCLTCSPMATALMTIICLGCCRRRGRGRCRRRLRGRKLKDVWLTFRLSASQPEESPAEQQTLPSLTGLHCMGHHERQGYSHWDITRRERICAHPKERVLPMNPGCAGAFSCMRGTAENSSIGRHILRGHH